MKKPKVLLGIVTQRSKNYCLDELYQCIEQINYDNFDVVFIDNSKEVFDYKYKTIHVPPDQAINEVLAKCQNILRYEVITNDYDYLFLLESDNIVEPDFLPYALSFNAPVFTCPYLVKLEKFNVPSLCMQFTQHGFIDNKMTVNSLMVTPDMTPYFLGHFGDTMSLTLGEDMYLTHTGIGTTLIRKDVLENIQFRTSSRNDKIKNQMTFSDSFFYVDCQLKNYNVLVETRILSKHLNQKLYYEN
jgi:hypothetical protein